MAKATNKRVFHMDVRGEKWKYRRVSLKYFFKLHPEYLKEDDENFAVMDDVAKTVDFVKGKITRATVRHELFHVYCRTLYLASTKMDASEIEEVQADMLAEHLDSYYNHCEEVYANLTA